MRKLLEFIGVALFLMLLFFVGAKLAYGGENYLAGTSAGSSLLTSGTDNTIVGDYAGMALTRGKGNSIFGMYAGNKGFGTNGTVKLGYMAGNTDSSSHKLFITTGFYPSYGIFGDFSTGYFGVNDTSPSYGLEVTGTGYYSGLLTLGGGILTTDRLATSDTLLVSKEQTPAAADSSWYVTIASGNPFMGFRATDGDLTNVGVNTSDQLLFQGATGGYIFDALAGFATGTAAAPSLVPSGDVDTGFYFLTATGNRVGIAAKGVNVATIDSAGLLLTGTISGRGAVAGSDTLFKIRDSLGKTHASIDSNGVAFVDTSHAVNSVTTGYNIVNGATILRGTVDTGRLAVREATVPTSDSLQTWRASLGNTVASVDSSGTLYAVKVDAAIDSADAASNSLAIGDVAGLQNRLDEKLLKTASGDSVSAYIARSTDLADSANFVSNALAQSDIAGLTDNLALRMLMAASNDSVSAYIARSTDLADSANFVSNALAKGDVAGLTDDLALRMLMAASGDSVSAFIARSTDLADSANFVANSLAQSDVAGLTDRLGEKQLASAFVDSLLSRKGKQWLVPLPMVCDTTASALDSTTVKPLMDINGLYGRKSMLYVYGNASTANDSTIWGATFNPQDDNPDSIIVWLYTTDEANTSASVEIYNSAGALVYSSGVLTCAAASAWEYKGVAFTTFADLNEHCIVYRVRVLNAADAVTIGQTYFKRN